MITLKKKCKKEKMHKKQVLMISTDDSTDDNNKKYHKVKDHCHYTGKYRRAAHRTYKISKEIPVVFHNSSTYDHHFITTELAEKFEEQFECLGENREKYITFSVPIKKQHDNDKTITYKIKFIDSFRFMSSTLSDLVDNLSKGLHSDKCTDCKFCLDYMITKLDQLIFRCFQCKKIYKKDFNKKLIKRFANIYEFCNEDINNLFCY